MSRKSSALQTQRSAGAVKQNIDDPLSVLGNPLRNFTPTQAVSMIEASFRGQWTRLQWLEMIAERMDGDLLTLIRQRAGAIREYVPSYQTIKGVDDALAKRQALALRQRYEQFENLYAAILHLSMATFRAYAHVRIDGNRFEPLDQVWFLRDGMYGDWYWNPDARITAIGPGNPAGLLKLPDTGYLIREDPSSVLLLAVWKHLYTSFGQKWWSAFCEIASRQGTVVIGPQEGDTNGTEFKDAAAAIAKGAGGFLPYGSVVQFSNAQRGPIPFREFLAYMSDLLAKAVMGGTLLTDSKPDSGKLAGGAHADGFARIVHAEAREISELFQTAIDKPLLAEKFPNAPVLAFFALETCDTPDPDKVVEHVNILAQHFDLDPEQISERTGYTLKAKAAPAVLPVMPGQSDAGVMNRAPAEGVATALGVPSSWLSPVTELLAEIEHKAADKTLSHADLLAFLEQAVARLPELFTNMDVTALADVLAAGSGAAVVDGVRAALATHA